MARQIFKAEVKVPIPKAIADRINRDAINGAVAAEADILVMGQIKRQIRSGLSPVQGFGRFGEYLNPRRYPGRGKNRLKPSRPVNLHLTGDMLFEYRVTTVGGNKLRFGIRPNASAFVKTKTKANNEGTEINNVGAIPRRRFIPLKGEQYTVSVMRILKNLLRKRIQSLFSK